MNDTFTSILVCLVAVVFILNVYAFVWLSKRGDHDELFPIVILCLGIPPLGTLIMLLTFLDGYQQDKEQTVQARPKCRMRFHGGIVHLPSSENPNMVKSFLPE